ncbi:MAG: hypothetical protein AAF514_09965 [Verrucomicrobiota bacterium]
MIESGDDLTSQNPQSDRAWYPITRWSLIANAKSGSDTQANRALNEICRVYWNPLYLSLRNTGLSKQDAEDRTQAFILCLIERQSLASVGPENGRLRTFLKASLTKFNNSAWRREYAQKRGGGKNPVPIDLDWNEPDPGSTVDPFQDFDRHWAIALLKSVFDRLETHYERKNKGDLYQSIKGCLEGDGKYEGGEEAAKRLNMSPEGVRSAVFQIRRKFRDYVKEEIADTCSSPEEAREELAYLCRMLTTQEISESK